MSLSPKSRRLYSEAPAGVYFRFEKRRGSGEANAPLSRRVSNN
jgi:hypothetical protein